MAFVSSKEPLDANEEIVLGPIQPGLADNVVGMVFADQGGTLYIEQSADEQSWDLSDAVTVAANDGEGFSRPVYGSHVRLRYVNGGVAQGVFRLTAKTSSAGPR